VYKKFSEVNRENGKDYINRLFPESSVLQREAII